LLIFLTGPAFAKKIPPSQPIDLNTATMKQLEQLPGIGPTRAEKIIEFRMKTPFRRVEDLLAVPGISKTRLEKLRPYIKVSSSASKKPSKSVTPSKTSKPTPTPTSPPSTDSEEESNQ